MFDWILNTSLSSYQEFHKIFRETFLVDFNKVFKRTIFQNAFDWMLLKVHLQNATSIFGQIRKS